MDSTGGNAGGVSLDHPQPPPTTQSSHGSSANGIARDGLHSAAENERCDDREEDQEADEEDEDDDLCEDVRGELADILSSDLEFTGAFSFNRAYPTAPNPSLNIDGLGTVGLPLSIRDAAAIKQCAEQAPFGMADRTIVDKSVRDTWEIDATKVHFMNAAWAPFMAQTVRDVCEVLGVNFQASQPRCELYKLLLYETGSHFLPHVDTEKVNGMFATIVVVLPSWFAGGAVRVAHGELSETYDNSANSLTTTSVLAWYTDVEHEVKHITAGYRLALSFNLIHTTSALRPALSPQNGVAARLRQVLLSWKEGESQDEAPAKLIYLLDHKYSQAALRGSALKGADAHLVALLDNIGRPHGFRLGLASLTCTERGSGNDYGGGCGYGRRGRYGRYGWGYSEDEDEDEDDVSMGEVEDTEISIKHLVDLDGKLIREDLDYELETEVIPDEVAEAITSGAYDEQEYEGYMGNYGGSLERFYRRTVLVIWPQWANFDIMHGANGLSYACDKLRTSTSLQPTPEESELANLVLTRASASHCTAIITSLCRVALTWRNLSLWKQAVHRCDATRSIAAFGGGSHIHRAVATFGFQEVKPHLEQALERDPSNVGALQFLDSFEEWVAKQQLPPSMGLTTEWIAAQRTKRFGALKKPPKDEHKPLTALAIKCGGVDFLERNVLPLIETEADSAVLLEYAVYLYREQAVPEETRARMARNLLLASILKLDIYSVSAPTQPASAYSYLRPQLEESKQLERIKPFVKACYDLKCEDLFSKVVSKVVDGASIAKDVLDRRVTQIFLPLIVYAGPMAIGSAVPEMHKLCCLAATQWLSAVTANPRTITATDISSVMQAMVSGGQPGVILTELLPKLETIALDNTLLRTLVQELHTRRAVLDPAGQNIQTVITRLLKRWASTITLASPTYGAYYGAAHAGRSKPTIDALEFCFSVNTPDACTFILTRLLNPPKLDGKYVQEQLAPLVPELRAFLVKHRQPLTSPAFAPVFRSIMQLWVQKVMGTRPPDTASAYIQHLQKWGCNCDVCKAVRHFLTSSPNEAQTWARIGAPKRKHVETFLQTYARTIATWAMIRSVPQGLTVTKSKVLLEPSRYAHHQSEGLKLLRSLSTNSSELQGILGSQYARIVALLQGHTPPANASAAAASGSNTNRAIASSTGVARPLAPNGSARALAVAPTPLTPHPGTIPLVAGASRPHVQASQGTQAMSGAGASSSTDQGPPAKRRKTAYDAGEVIDLT
ncbi:hypothetical protein OH76DRAFT_1401917 [Lentinus brumalis]|uniref:Uncharacterized protein n=1 Tax=Lentinus brumalis TaxID=2498619 RepID=A0A371DF20_9APHY|nr:hypothetical protein OH76DRAFT_1401917 [Polyporus brumalis]